MARKIHGGTPASRVTKHWRLSKVTDNIAKLIGAMKGLIFQAVRRNVNVVVDHLENHGIEHPNEIWDSCWQQVDNQQLRGKCIQLSRLDMVTAEESDWRVE